MSYKTFIGARAKSYNIYIYIYIYAIIKHINWFSIAVRDTRVGAAPHVTIKPPWLPAERRDSGRWQLKRPFILKQPCTSHCDAWALSEALFIMDVPAATRGVRRPKLLYYGRRPTFGWRLGAWVTLAVSGWFKVFFSRAVGFLGLREGQVSPRYGHGDKYIYICMRCIIIYIYIYIYI